LKSFKFDAIEVIEAAAVPGFNKDAWRARSIARHDRMLEADTAPFDFGMFYDTMLKAGLWTTPAGLAKAMSVSVRHVSAKRRLTRIPEELADFFGRAEITESVATILERPLQHYGLPKLIKRAALVPNDASFDEKVTAIFRAEAPPENSLTEAMAVYGMKFVRECLVSDHQSMIQYEASAHDFAMFYNMVLTQEVWPTLAALARAMGVPASRVRQALFLAEFPASIADLFFHEKITPRVAKALSYLVASNAKAVLTARVKLVPEDATLYEKLTALAGGEPPGRAPVSAGA
jgi:hypothetical protein